MLNGDLSSELRVPGTRQTSKERRTLVCNKIVDHSNAVGASPASAAPITT